MTVQEYTQICLDFAKQTKEWGYLPVMAIYSTTNSIRPGGAESELGAAPDPESGWCVTTENKHGGIPVDWAYGKDPIEIRESARGKYFQFFADVMESRVPKFLPEKLNIESVELVTVRKNNDQLMHALTIRETDVNAAPTIYLENLFDQFCEDFDRPDTNSFDEYAKRIADIHVANRPSQSLDLSALLDWEKVKEQVVPRLVNKTSNSELLRERPYTAVGREFAVTYHILLEKEEFGQASVPISDSIMRNYQITVPELHQQAMDNYRSLYPAQVTSMFDTLAEMMGGEDESLSELEDMFEGPRMYVITNEKKQFGSISIIDPDTMQMIGDKLHADKVYVLPSSVHECILLPDDGTGAPDMLQGMIQEVNSSQLDPVEVLSDKLMVMYPKEQKLMLWETNQILVAQEEQKKIVSMKEHQEKKKEQELRQQKPEKKGPKL